MKVDRHDMRDQSWALAATSGVNHTGKQRIANGCRLWAVVIRKPAKESANGKCEEHGHYGTEQATPATQGDGARGGRCRFDIRLVTVTTLS